MAKTIHVRKAGTIRDEKIEDVEIFISDHVKHKGQFDKDAQILCEALYNSLPGGTFDRLTILMMTKIASSYTITRKEAQDA